MPSPVAETRVRLLSARIGELSVSYSRAMCHCTNMTACPFILPRVDMCCFLFWATVIKTAENTLVHVFGGHVCLQKCEAEWCAFCSGALTEMSSDPADVRAQMLNQHERLPGETLPSGISPSTGVCTGMGFRHSRHSPRAARKECWGVGGWWLSLRWSMLFEISRKALMKFTVFTARHCRDVCTMTKGSKFLAP